ncbi:MAG: hypothetical protein ABSH14_01580 [Verrucomicrobiia bacterium]|jgi:hypothetical protein
MSRDSIEIHHSSHKVGGYFTEVIQGTSSQAAINMVRARVPDASISWLKYLPAPTSSDRPTGGGSTGRRP